MLVILQILVYSNPTELRASRNPIISTLLPASVRWVPSSRKSVRRVCWISKWRSPLPPRRDSSDLAYLLTDLLVLSILLWSRKGALWYRTRGIISDQMRKVFGRAAFTDLRLRHLPIIWHNSFLGKFPISSKNSWNDAKFNPRFPHQRSVRLRPKCGQPSRVAYFPPPRTSESPRIHAGLSVPTRRKKEKRKNEAKQQQNSIRITLGLEYTDCTLMQCTHVWNCWYLKHNTDTIMAC